MHQRLIFLKNTLKLLKDFGGEFFISISDSMIQNPKAIKGSDFSYLKTKIFLRASHYHKQRQNTSNKGKYFTTHLKERAISLVCKEHSTRH